MFLGQIQVVPTILLVLTVSKVLFRNKGTYEEE
jgi:hypothetical protein